VPASGNSRGPPSDDLACRNGKDGVQVALDGVFGDDSAALDLDIADAVGVVNGVIVPGYGG
jgi:hypothetical protein